jgi:DNA repair exonuclease SbcCD nuclease subunit
MRIVHISDVHIRNLKYHEDYRRVFDDLYGKLLELKPDLVINTGDTAHTKTDISPEFVDLCSEHIRTVAEIAPYHILLGNHDLNLQNPNRRDAISPIVDSIGGTSCPIYLHKDSGLVHREQFGDVVTNIWSFSCADQDNFPKPKDWEKYHGDVNIGLYHGSLMQSETDIGWRMTEADDDLKLFTGLDFVLLGDIHKHQFLDPDGRVAYAGSLVQQNFGESPDKGFLVWDIENKDEFNVRHVKLNGDRKFFTVRLNDDLSIPNLDIGSNSRIRVISPKPCTLVEQQAFEKEIREKFNPFSVISLTARNTKEQAISRAHKLSGKTENLRDPGVQEKLIKKYLEDAKLSEEVMNKILELNSHYHMTLEKQEEVTRHTQWNIDSIAWNNMFNYGENNVLDFRKTKGVIGMFAPNSSGKSSLIDIITETLFDKTTKGTSKNIFLVNDNKDSAQMLCQLSIGGRTYVIERVINRIKYGKKKFDKEKEWGKTSLRMLEN